jgi:predicted RNase H-like HicB family nuclease
VSDPQIGNDYNVLLIEEMRDDCNRWFAEHPELLGCTATGGTQEEALANLTLSRDAWLLVANKRGIPIPPPPAAVTVETRFAERSYIPAPSEAFGSDSTQSEHSRAAA